MYVSISNYKNTTLVSLTHHAKRITRTLTCSNTGNCGPGKISWDALVFSKKEYRAWKDQFKPGDLVTFLFMPTECILAMHCKRWGRGGVRVSSLGPIPKSRRKSDHTPGSDDIFHVMFGAAMKNDSVSLIGEKVALPKPLKEFLSRNIGKSE